MKKKRKKFTSRKERQRTLNLLMVLFGVLIVFAIMNDEFQLHKKPELILKSIPLGNVEKYTPLLQKELEKVQLEEYTPLLAAVMQQESKGRGGDPMQASESAGLPPNTIKNPEESIQQGVKHFHRAVHYGEKKNVDLPTIVQAYNMGLGYIDFVAGKGGEHKEELAKEFSYMQVQKNPDLYNCGGDKNNFRYPYCYGDFTYSTKVFKNIEATTSFTLKRSEMKIRKE
ncbi:lysozyme family protein [Neobacillus notoginsengisoli]|uniref:Lysozyme family protein n=1 Tax=Neobacillus notoginsengisoli TaxID=1578198 RepID=A0A417YPS1_9BACI|nr:lysozyme family protein [Neobacillus notoginsengisoli]RHW35716.1 lysozyme family protein [Neobacillus notoginsengisoli]